MNTRRDSMLEELFHEALAIDPADRAAFVEERCADAELRTELEALLEVDARCCDTDVLGAWAAHSDVGAGASAGRYELGTVLGRGGMGVVVRAHDPMLGRDVALKMLDGLARRDPGLVRRFTAEARISGQLEHPGIVPVYEFGEHDGLPFIAMKLIEGRTLADLLAERDGAHAERVRFLTIFERVCQTMAFAHTRGVTHRDLKPANVMVGEFGEVQVVDWGMAEFTAADERTGVVMGTPAYMSPEQATGADDLDARTDVFGLGAILTEILTGAPPYRGGDDLVARARAADLGDALGRLAAPGMDPELAGLARSCLAPREQRLPDAARVAELIGTYLTRIEQRAHAAEVAAAEQRVRAEEARRKQRLTLGLAIAVLTVVVGSWFAWTEIQRTHEAARERARLQAERALAEAGELRVRAENAPPGELAPWNRAEEAARRAAQLATGTARTDVRRRVAAAVAAAATGRATARALHARIARDAAFAARLDEIQIPVDATFTMPAGRARDAMRRDDEYHAEFRGYGIDCDALPAAGAAKAIDDSRITGRLCLALDDWAEARRTSGRAWRGLFRIANLVDPNGARVRLRNAMLAGPVALDAVHRETGWWQREPRTVLLFVNGLRARGRADEAASMLEKARQNRPQSFLLAVHAGIQHETCHNLEGAFRNYSVAVALRPDNVLAHYRLGCCSFGLGRIDQAHYELATVTRLRPHLLAPWINLSAVLARKGFHERAASAARAALAIDADSYGGLVNLAGSLHHLGRFDEALSHLRRAIAVDGHRVTALYAFAETAYKQGDTAQALKAARRVCRIDPKHESARARWVRCLLDKGKKKRAAEILDQGLRLLPGSRKLHVLEALVER